MDVELILEEEKWQAAAPSAAQTRPPTRGPRGNGQMLVLFYPSGHPAVPSRCGPTRFRRRVLSKNGLSQIDYIILICFILLTILIILLILITLIRLIILISELW